MEVTIGNTVYMVGPPTMRRRDALRRIYADQLNQVSDLQSLIANDTSPVTQATVAMRLQEINDRTIIEAFRVIATNQDGSPASLPPSHDEFWYDVDLSQLRKAVDFFNSHLT